MLLFVDQWNDIPLNSKFVQIKAPNINLFHFFSNASIVRVLLFWNMCTFSFVLFSFAAKCTKSEVLNS